MPAHLLSWPGRGLKPREAELGKHLADIGEWVMESKTGAELIARVQEWVKNG